MILVLLEFFSQKMPMSSTCLYLNKETMPKNTNAGFVISANKFAYREITRSIGRLPEKPGIFSEQPHFVRFAKYSLGVQVEPVENWKEQTYPFNLFHVSRSQPG